jgi:dihydroneopterin aldolase
MSQIKTGVVQPLHQPEEGPGIRRVFVRDLVLAALIGVHRHEQDGRQRVRINLDLEVPEDGAPLSDRLSEVVNYQDIVAGIRKIVAAGHINLVETLAERIAARCLVDRRVQRVRVRVEKLDVFADAGSVGVEIARAHPTR